MNNNITFRQILILLLALYIIHTLMENIEYFTTKDTVLDEIRAQLAVLHPKFQNVELYEGDKSYTINKKRVYICLKNDDGRYYNRNMLVYVTLHEYAHILCNSVWHTDEFYDIFDELLNKASDAGLYNPSLPIEQEYCGMWTWNFIIVY